MRMASRPERSGNGQWRGVEWGWPVAWSRVGMANGAERMAWIGTGMASGLERSGNGQWRRAEWGWLAARSRVGMARGPEWSEDGQQPGVKMAAGWEPVESGQTMWKPF
ncbi:hypothetical protein chiPu_0002105 [Chiloscyllium punctatum]|uniref:Uncharacterized protein n=1 Tax=Chiloscyllium punctatum TaxID=137246 RepID=A0A401RZX7_CHIPU|nr:hypothetical protein [Chiloscyllium punctatum]